EVRCFADDAPQSSAGIDDGGVILEHVRHRGTEDSQADAVAGGVTVPPRDLGPPRLGGNRTRAVRTPDTQHGRLTLRLALGVAPGTSSRDLHAPAPRVEGVVRPLDF